MNKLIEAIGWMGVVCIIAAYALNSFDVVSAQSGVYIGLNIAGSVGIIIDAVKDRNYQPVALNIVWIVIAIVNIIILFI